MTCPSHKKWASLIQVLTKAHILVWPGEVDVCCTMVTLWKCNIFRCLQRNSRVVLGLGMYQQLIVVVNNGGMIGYITNNMIYDLWFMIYDKWHIGLPVFLKTVWYPFPLPFSRKSIKKNEVLNSWNVVFPSFPGTKEHVFNWKQWRFDYSFWTCSKFGEKTSMSSDSKLHRVGARVRMSDVGCVPCVACGNLSKRSWLGDVNPWESVGIREQWLDQKSPWIRRSLTTENFIIPQRKSPLSTGETRPSYGIILQAAKCAIPRSSLQNYPRWSESPDIFIIQVKIPGMILEF